jgi:hypothetical protein
VSDASEVEFDWTSDEEEDEEEFQASADGRTGAWICFGNTVLECGPDSRAANCWGKLQMSENEAPGIDAGAMFMIKLQMDRSSASSSAS